MEKTSRHKVKNKKTAVKSKSPKKRKSEGPTCSMFLSEITKRLALKKKNEEEAPKNIVQMIIDSITNALPVKFFKRPPENKDSPPKVEDLQNYVPETAPIVMVNNDTTEVKTADVEMIDLEQTVLKPSFKVPKMPIVNSEVIRLAAEKTKRVQKENVAVNTGGNNDVAIELTKHVNTLKKISLIAEEFNKKTAKNLKEIVDSVQDELIKKIEAIQGERAIEISEN